MSDIEWTGLTWNPMAGCTPVVTRDASGKRHPSGCDHCYATGQVRRFAAVYDRPTTIKIGAERPSLTFVPTDDDGRSLRKGAKWTGAVWLLPHMLDVPLRRRKPTTYFVNSVSDVFHESVIGCEEGRQFVAALFGVMAACPQHTFQILTKRPDRAREWFAWLSSVCTDHPRLLFQYLDDLAWSRADIVIPQLQGCSARRVEWPLANVWIGASVSTQTDADQRIPALLEVPAAVRFISAEPLLGPIDFVRAGAIEWNVDGDPRCDHRATAGTSGVADWIIAGGESGPKARPCEIAWLRSIVRQCQDAGVPCFVKQVGARPVFEPGAEPRTMSDAKGGDMAEWPEDLRVRQMPEDA